MIYDYALDDNHDVFADGLPSLLKVCPKITREIYSYRDIVTTVVITDATPEAYEESAQPMLSRYIDTIMRFDQRRDTKELVVKFKPQERSITTGSGTSREANRSICGSRIESKACFYSTKLNLACASRMVSHLTNLVEELKLLIEKKMEPLIVNGSEIVSQSGSGVKQP